MVREPDCELPMMNRTAPVLNRMGRLKQYSAAISVSVGAFAVGNVLSWTSAALPQIVINLQEQSTPLISNISNEQFADFKISHSEEALVGASLTIGALVSAIPSGFLADKFGRRKTLLTLSLPFLINWILVTFAQNFGMLVVARLIAGISVGGFCVVAPMYIGEIAEVSYRGTFGSYFQMFLCCGILFTTIIGSFTSWVELSLILGSIPIIFSICFYSMPETPIYLIKKCKVIQAETVLRELRGFNYDISSEIQSVQTEIEQARNKTLKLADVLKAKNYIKSTISVVGVLAFQQLSGINAIIFYSVSIFEATGSEFSPNIASIIINLVQVVTSYISIILIEKANRKFYLIVSASGMFFSLSSLGMFFHFKSLEVELVGSLCIIPIISVVLYMVAFAIGFGPIPWMLMSELFAPEIKGAATGVAVLTNWIFAFLVTFSFPLLNLNFGPHVTFYLFSGLMVLAIIFIHYVVPETKGKTLLEIQKSLSI